MSRGRDSPVVGGSVQRAGVWFALVLVLACSAQPARAPQGAAADESFEPSVASEKVDENATAAEDEGVAESTQRFIDRRLAVICALRGLEAKHPVRGEELTGQQMVEHVKRNIEAEVPVDVITATNSFLYLAGVVDRGFDYKASLLDVMGSDLAGFYDPDQKAMYLRKGLGRLERGATLAHELVHALQDQHYDLASLDRWEPDASDRRSALHGLAEGDATSAMLDGMVLGSGRTALDLPEQALSMQVGALANDSSVEDIVLRAVVAPYVDGLRFVHALRRQGGWERVDEAWRRPPESTEQLLHPEKYLAGEAPEAVDLPVPPPGASLRRIYQDIEGEQALRILFQEWFEADEAERFAADWAGDRLSVFSSVDDKAFAWVIRYDTVGAAKRAMEGMKGWQTEARGAPGAGQVGSLSAPYCGEDDERGPLAMARRGRDIAVVAGPTKLAPGCPMARRWLSNLLPPGSK